MHIVAPPPWPGARIDLVTRPATNDTASNDTATNDTATNNTVIEARARVSLVDVAARDGLQSEETLVSTADKVELVRRLEAAGVRRAEVVSFVNPTRVPQMADAREVMAALATPGTLADRASMSLAGLVLNARGLDGAIETGVDEINVVVVSTDTYATRNQSRTTAELIDTWHQVGERARSHGLRTTVTLAAAFGCPFEGELPEGRLTSVARAILQVRPDEFALADSIGVAAPTDIERGIDVVRSLDADVPLRCHFHNTRNTGIANVVAALRHGVRTFDASLGGIGGCPFAPDATGNVPTEDVLYLLHRMGIDTGIDLDAIIGIVPWLRSVIGHDTPGLVSRAGNFPPR